MAGQGTIALEILEDLPDLEAILIPIGGGGLISGIAMALRLALPRLVDDLVVVSDQEIREAIPVLMERAQLVTEPAGAATVAAPLAKKFSLPKNAKTVALVSGSNLDVSGTVSLNP